ncbi:MAG: hypothetical protein JJ992_12160, partial [Planctomycetes bacterium]|nr:hypothetical protein [Planctomycetota bacterium]
LLMILAACGGDDDSSTSPPDNGGGGGGALSAPVGVAVVAGDTDSTEVQNTISWAQDPDAVSYTVYWSNTAGVTESSSVVVPAAAGARYVVHSDVDVLAGNSYFYRVQASSADGSSGLSDEAVGTPQRAITSNQLNDVAFNGTDTIVAVGDAGIILSSPDGTANAWTDVSPAAVPESLSGVTWESINSQFMIVGAGSTVLSGDGSNWVQEDLSNLSGSRNLQDVAWLGDRYIAVGNNGAILTSNGDGSAWAVQDPGVVFGNTAFNAVAYDGNTIVVVGGNGTILTSADAIARQELPQPTNNDLNDITWDGSQFIVVGSNDTILTSPDGVDWTSHVPGTSDINFVAVTHWDAGLPATPVVAAVGSSGTFVVRPAADPGVIVHTGTNELLDGLAWVDNGVDPVYFMIVGHNGTVLTSQLP